MDRGFAVRSIALAMVLLGGAWLGAPAHADPGDERGRGGRLDARGVAPQETLRRHFGAVDTRETIRIPASQAGFGGGAAPVVSIGFRPWGYRSYYRPYPYYSYYRRPYFGHAPLGYYGYRAAYSPYAPYGYYGYRSYPFGAFSYGAYPYGAFAYGAYPYGAGYGGWYGAAYAPRYGYGNYGGLPYSYSLRVGPAPFYAGCLYW